MQGIDSIVPLPVSYKVDTYLVLRQDVDTLNSLPLFPSNKQEVKSYYQGKLHWMQ